MLSLEDLFLRWPLIGKTCNSLLQTKMNTTHSPLPWSNNVDTIWRGNKPIVILPVNDPQSIADAAFIVTACNSHAALLGALETLLADYQSLFQAYSDELLEQGITASAEKSEAVTEQARQALALAKGETK